jgi:hypothetical protein
MALIDKIKFLLNGESIEELADKEYKRGYDQCHDEAMRHLASESRKDSNEYAIPQMGGK